MSFKTTLDKCLGLVKEVRAGEGNYVCYTKYSELDQRFVIGVSDGEAVWMVGLTEKELKERCEPRDQASYLTDLSQAIQSGEVTVSRSGDTATLKCGSLDTFCLTLESGSAALQSLVFHLVDELCSVGTKLRKCERELETTRRQAAADKQVYADVSMGGPSTKRAIGRPKRTAGASLINPRSKKRKAATGVVFDSNSATNS